ncbi:hypothetical protein FOXYSP1_15948 [Fusarium oxysporum f. sp. phaseoli]
MLAHPPTDNFITYSLLPNSSSKNPRLSSAPPI